VHEAGNLAARSVTRLIEKNPQVGLISQPLPAWGGRAGEVPDDVHARILDELKSVTRAVTLQDCEILAKAAPGGVVSVARGTAESHPDLPGVPCPGVVSLIVLPLLPANLPDPTPGLLRLISCYLNRRTVPGTRIEVAGPIYRKVSVSAQIRINQGTSPAAVLAAAGVALRQFFHPLYGGPEGDGWAIGRDVFHAEVLAALGATPGAAGVPLLEMSLDGGPPLCANLCLGPRGLPSLDPPVITIAPATTGREGRACP
jgi:predicted phage baseplate assembly protein